MSVITHFLLWSVGLAKPWTFYGSAECHCLARHVCGKRRVVEIGCWHGLNTRRLRAGMARDGVLFCVDPYAVGLQRSVDHRATGSVESVQRVSAMDTLDRR